MSLPQPTPTERPADWEAFYRDYRKPGYVSGFEITTKLGGGMFGLVFRARKQSIGKDYAIKFLQVDDGEVRRAVLAELEQVKFFAQIDHPNLVSIEDRGEVDGIPYLVMAFAGSETLRDRIPATGNPPSPAERDELLRYFLQCCRGLAALHERSLVHFDIKPANVFLKGAVARLGDYGLSKLVTHSRGSLSMGRGTPYYMAPEMLQRRGDHRSDIYSLGVMLYEILCGRVPFQGDSEWEVLRKHETEAPALPAHLSALERAVLQRCLQKDPAARYQSVHDLIAAFGAPSSAGAAAWTDVRAGAGTAPPPAGPPPLPDPPPPPLSDDPYAGFGRASREAARHAAKIARRAMVQARHAAKRAARSANEAMREAMDRSSNHGMRRWQAWNRLREQRKTWKEQREAMRAAAAIAAPQRRRNRGSWLTALAVLAALVFLPMVLMTMGEPSMYTEATSAADRPATVVEPRQTLRVFHVPPQYAGLVSRSEPPWVLFAQQDRDHAHDVLVECIEQLRREAPLSPALRATRLDLPSFEVITLDGRTAQRVHTQLDQFLSARSYDRGIAEKLAKQAPASLVIAAGRLDEIRWEDAADRKRAQRLQQFLEQTTGCRDLPLIDDGTPEAEVANKNLPGLWMWFVNEFGNTPRTWEAYRSLLKLK
jgi:hypothetical protein